MQKKTHIVILPFFQAFLIAFTSEFIPKLFYSYRYNWDLEGYVNFTMAISPNKGWVETGKDQCR